MRSMNQRVPRLDSRDQRKELLADHYWQEHERTWGYHVPTMEKAGDSMACICVCMSLHSSAALSISLYL